MSGSTRDPLRATRKQLAEILGVSVRQISTLEADRVIEPSVLGRGGKASIFSLPETVQAYLQYRLRESSPSSSGALDLDGERAALAREQRRKLEMANDETEGRLLARQDVVRAGRAFVEGWKAKILILAARARLTGVISREQEPGLKALCRDILMDIASWKTVADAMSDVPDEDGDGAGPDEDDGEDEP